MADTPTDIDIDQGATFRMQVTWADTTTSPAVPISLAGYWAHMQFRSKAGSLGTPLLNLSSLGIAPALILEPDDVTGALTIRIGAEQTALLKKNCFYDLFVVQTIDASEATRLIHGAVTVSKSVTVNP